MKAGDGVRAVGKANGLAGAAAAAVTVGGGAELMMAVVGTVDLPVVRAAVEEEPKVKSADAEVVVAGEANAGEEKGEERCTAPAADVTPVDSDEDMLQ